MKGSLKIGSIAGIKLFIHWTFAILIAYLVYSNYRRGYDAAQIGWSVLFVLSIFVTVLLHELGHALTAKRYDIKTKDITLLPIGGLARLERMPEKPSEELKVALAGPAVNIVLALITWLLIDLPDAAQMVKILEKGVNADNFFLNFFFVNLWLAIFNLIPAFPMDGGRVLRALLSMRYQRHEATRIAARIGQALAVVFIFAGFFINPFLMFIGLFVFLGARAEAEYTQTQSVLKGFTVDDVLMKEIPSVQSGEPVKTAVDLMLNGQNKNFLVMENDQPVGTLSRDDIIKALYEKGENTSIGHIMNRELVTLRGDQSLEKIYLRLPGQKPSLMLVRDNGHLKGVVDTENIMEFILVKSALNKIGAAPVAREIA